jgi:hypothetical protein
MTERRLDYEKLKLLAEELNRPVKTLLAQGAESDPFYADLPMRRLRAEWVAKLWKQLDIPPGAHPRRVHYRIISQSRPIKLPREVNGSWEYVNNTNCAIFLGDALSDARYLGLIPIDHIADQRNTPTVVNYNPVEASAGVVVSDATLESVELSLDVAVPEFPDLPELHVVRPSIPQPYCIEVWVEKSTVDDVLAPLCELHGVNYTSGAGDISITRCNDLIERAREHGKPVRVLAVVDFDPGGANMPVSLAQKLEFLIHTTAPDLDVQVRQVALTRGQVRRYRLPGIPIRDSNPQAAEFERRHGVEGATELDALEALRPGELRKIVTKEIKRYIDPDLDANIRAAHREVQDELDEINEATQAEHEAETERLEREHDALAEEVQEFVERIRQRFEAKFRARFDDLTERTETLIHGLTVSLEDKAPDPDTIDWPEPEPADEDEDPLFDSTRDYVEQIDRFKEYQDKPTTRQPRNGKGDQ